MSSSLVKQSLLIKIFHLNQQNASVALQFSEGLVRQRVKFRATGYNQRNCNSDFLTNHKTILLPFTALVGQLKSDSQYGMKNIMKDYPLLSFEDQSCTRVTSHQKGIDFCSHLLCQIGVYAIWLWNIFWGYMVLFYQNGTTNTQNC